MVERFDDDEDKYLSWAEANPLGYVANVVKTDRTALFPMVHAVRHALWTSKRESYTRADYIKVCSGNLHELERWAQGNYGRPLSHCRGTLQAEPSAISDQRPKSVVSETAGDDQRWSPWSPSNLSNRSSEPEEED